MRKILITTDFSPQASQTIEHVLKLLQGSDSAVSVLLLNTYLLPKADPSKVIEMNDELKRRSRDGLAESLQKAEAENSNPLVSIQTASHLGSLFNVVQNLMGQEKYETVSFCEGGPQKVAELITKKKCPVLITCS